VNVINKAVVCSHVWLYDYDDDYDDDDDDVKVKINVDLYSALS